MQYISTRGHAPALDFEAVTLTGLASDGGLYLPDFWPRFTEAEILEMAGLPYAELAARIMQPFVEGSLTDAELLALCTKAYGRFSHEAVTPLKQIDSQNWILELFHGPTLAFKDIALQLLGLLFETFLSRRKSNLTIIGATSGDTGSAAIDAVAGREGIEIFMLHPNGRISDVQRRQMTTVSASNVYNIAIEGSFDDAQAMVKRMFNDEVIANQYNIGAVNSINWARLMAQVVYYFASALQLGAPAKKIAFSVPTGNFGDVFAGYVAAQMGLPVSRLIVATNVNDILHRAISERDYSVANVTRTNTPSMDIQVSSNFERLLFESNGRNASLLNQQMRGFDAKNSLRLTEQQSAAILDIFVSSRVDQGAVRETILWARSVAGEIIDPHTAVGLHAARKAGIEYSTPIVTLATAHPAKFPEAVSSAIGIEPTVPSRLSNIFDQKEIFTELPSEYDEVRNFVMQHATSAI